LIEKNDKKKDITQFVLFYMKAQILYVCVCVK